MPGCEDIARCYACSTCTAGCPVRSVTDRYNPRRIIRMIQMGMRDAVLRSDFIWLCTGCFTCQERCPQEIRIADLMIALRNLAVREGFMPDGHKKQSDQLLKYGRLYEIDDFDNKKRRKDGLPELPTDPSDFQILRDSLSDTPEDDS